MTVEVQPHDCPRCGERTAGGLDDHCMACGWRPGQVQDNATITVKKAVDGTKKRRAPKKGARKVLAEAHLRVDEGVGAAAKQARRDGQRIQIVSETEVMVVNK